MPSESEWRRIMESNLRDPSDVMKAMSALEDVSYAAADEVESNWVGSGGRPGKPWTELGKVAGRATVSARKALRRWWGG